MGEVSTRRGRSTLVTMDGGSTGRSRVVWLLALTAALMVVLSSCSINRSSEPAEIDDGSDSAATDRTPPTLPPDGVLTTESAVEGLAFDLSDRPADMDYWAPRRSEARCAATAIVDALGAERLAELGYMPATQGASLNDLELADDERGLVVTALEGCLDVEESIAAIFYGNGRMAPSAATCMARTLTAGGHTGPFLLGLASGEAVDPFADDGRLAAGLLDGASVCIAETEFDWPDVRLDDPEVIIDADAPPGAADSPFADDRRSDSTTSAPPESGP